jgi:hypothetical protein
LKFVNFLLFFLLGHPERRIIKLTRISSYFFMYFFYWTLIFFLLSISFEILIFFILILYRRLWVSQVSSGWLKCSSLTLYFLKLFFLFHILFLDLKLCNFLLFFFLRVISILYPGSRVNIVNPGPLKLSSPGHLFYIRKNLTQPTT